MNFNSIQFAIFLPIVFAIYWALPHKFRCGVLLIASYYFYMSWNPKYVVLILVTTFVSYISAIAVEKASSEKKKKGILAIALIVCLGILFFFKYFNFISESIVDLFAFFAIQLNPITLKVLLPVGISFYTFQTLSYVIDVYKGQVNAEKNFVVYATFISFFPQLVAGPIERTRNLLPQITSEKSFDENAAFYGARQMLWGFFKKIAVADLIAVYVDNAYADLLACSGFDLVIAVFFFTIQIYCDFSGYSDIAIGTAKLLGINLMTNFRSPYFALSVKEFWSRWHISLSTWFRDYVYIPMGGNRCSKAKNYRNLLVTFLVSGLWHGANWTYVIWGGIHGLAQILEKILHWDGQAKSLAGKIIRWFLTFAFCNIAWVFFRAKTFSDALFVLATIVKNLANISFFTYNNVGLTPGILLYSMLMILIVFVYDYMALKMDMVEACGRLKPICRIMVEYAIVILICISIWLSTGSNQFVYFQF